MITGFGTLPTLFLGPIAFLLAALLVLVLVLVIAPLVFSLSWKLFLFAAAVLGVLWLGGVLGFGFPDAGVPGHTAMIR